MEMLHQGLNMEVIPKTIFPAGKEFFDHAYVENYAAIHHPEAAIVHNNWIKGHKDKLKRFSKYKLWDLEGLSFPECSERRRRRRLDHNRGS